MTGLGGYAAMATVGEEHENIKPTRISFTSLVDSVSSRNVPLTVM